MIADHFFCDVCRFQIALFHFRGDLCNGSAQFITAAIVQCDMDEKTCFILRKVFNFQNAVLNILIQTMDVPNDIQTNIILQESFEIILQVLTEQIHNGIYFFLRTFPVFCGKSVHSQMFYAQITTVFNDSFQCFRTCFMPCFSGQETFLCPSAVTIHDDGNMLRHSFHINFVIFCFCLLKKHFFPSM